MSPLLPRRYIPLCGSWNVESKPIEKRPNALTLPRAAHTKRRTRIQEEKEEAILEAALEVFASHGFRGSTIDQIADHAAVTPLVKFGFEVEGNQHPLRVSIRRRLVANYRSAEHREQGRHDERDEQREPPVANCHDS